MIHTVKLGYSLNVFTPQCKLSYTNFQKLQQMANSGSDDKTTTYKDNAETSGIHKINLLPAVYIVYIKQFQRYVSKFMLTLIHAWRVFVNLI